MASDARLTSIGGKGFLNPPQSREVFKDRAKESTMILLLRFSQPFFLCVFAVGVGVF
jgi:hypothetical protein